MDMQTTLGMNESKALAEQLRGEILAALADGKPLTARELLDRCDSAEGIDKVTCQLGRLKKSCEIQQTGWREPTEKKKGAKAVPLYGLLSGWPEPAPLAQEQAAKLADVIESTLEYDPASVAFSESRDGDEFERSGCRGKCGTETDQDDDPILSAIGSLRSPRFPDAERDVERLVALADSPCIAAQPLIATWLLSLSARLEDAA